MNFAITYLLQRTIYRLLDFVRHWYVDGSRNLFHWFISSLERLDRTLAIRVTLKYFFQPLYKDFTIIGRILGVFFRSARIIVALLIYVFILVLFAFIYVGWLVVLPAILIYAAYAKYRF